MTHAADASDPSPPSDAKAANPSDEVPAKSTQMDGPPIVRDIDRRMKPDRFFSTFPAAAGVVDPRAPVIFRPDPEFAQSVEQDIAQVRASCARISSADLYFPAPAAEGAYGALQGFKPGDALGISDIPADVPLLVIGDVHADAWSLAAALRLAHEPAWLEQLGVIPAGTKPAVVMLGDLVDRGPHHVECILLAAARIKSAPTRTVWIAGNHDVGHRWVESTGAFESELSPAEIADWLNGGPPDKRAARVAFGKAFLNYVCHLPRAVAFRSGLLATHGGVPHCDIFHTLDSLSAVQASDGARDDFTWLRVAEKAPVKYPNRSRRGCEIGTEQLVASVAHLSQLIEKAGYPRINALVRGHDHHGDRHFVHAAGFPPMSLLTVNTMSASDDKGNPFITGDLQPCVAIYVQGRAPRVVKILTPDAMVQPEPGDSSAAAEGSVASPEAATTGTAPVPETEVSVPNTGATPSCKNPTQDAAKFEACEAMARRAGADRSRSAASVLVRLLTFGLISQR